jgi:hypothetical protein
LGKRVNGLTHEFAQVRKGVDPLSHKPNALAETRGFQGENQVVASRVRYGAKHVGDFKSVPATGKEIRDHPATTSSSSTNTKRSPTTGRGCPSVAVLAGRLRDSPESGVSTLLTDSTRTGAKRSVVLPEVAKRFGLVAVGILRSCLLSTRATLARPARITSVGRETNLRFAQRRACV